MSAIIEWGMDAIPEISERMKRGEVGIFPCDTIYGICAIINEETRERIYEIKERPESKRLLVLSDKSSLDDIGVIVPSDILSLWPAPFTAILPTTSNDTLAVRVPSDPFLAKLLPLTGPIFSTSVNISGHPSLQSFDEIYPIFNDRADFIVRKMDLQPGLSSTLVDATKKPYQVIRQGKYKFSL